MSELTSLTAGQRRVLGVLIEKALTTPQNYPLSLNAVVTGCNQKSNRYPVVEWVDEEVDGYLEELKKLRLVTVVFPASGRTEKYRQEFGRLLELDGQQLAVMGELLLRGPQAVGELRGRAARMKPIPTLDDLDRVLGSLASRPQPLVVRLTPPGVKRGVRYCHNLYTEKELERIRESEPEPGAASEGGGSAPSRSSAPSSGLEARIAALEARLAVVEGRLGIESGEE